MEEPEVIGKAERTRHRILEAARPLIEANGFDKLTMRELAVASHLSLGAFYYHYKSKEAVIQDLYRESFEGHLNRTQIYLQTAPRKIELIMDWICRDRFKEFAKSKSMLRVLAQRLDPEDPISPLHSSSEHIRLESFTLFERVVAHALPRVDPETRGLLAQALWLQHLMVLAFWAFDRSGGTKKTEKLLLHCGSVWRYLPASLKIPGAKSLIRLLLGPLSEILAGMRENQ